MPIIDRRQAQQTARDLIVQMERVAAKCDDFERRDREAAARVEELRVELEHERTLRMEALAATEGALAAARDCMNLAARDLADIKTERAAFTAQALAANALVAAFMTLLRSLLPKPPEPPPPPADSPAA